ncbi:MAG: M28 family peptidase [Tannerellaceae bacterium]|jgi:hypothetical protein|nr:M28 family peptidase [Tannerellaceae bacterium]
MNTLKIILLACGGILVSCANKGSGETGKAGNNTPQAVHTPIFNADSAYIYVQNQVSFGPRVPNTPAHRSCGDYLSAELQRLGGQMHIQEMTLTAYNGDRLSARNIIASFNPSETQRILLFAHWDSRPCADRETDSSRQHLPIDGADDGGSGAGILLEIARQIGQTPPSTGIDIILFDAEDYGSPEFEKTNSRPDTWCLGSQFWSKNPHVPNYTARFGILLDMVGARNATFLKEYTSMEKAPQIVDKVWNAARNLGYGRYFIDQKGGYIIDDHQYVISGRRIPCIDIINYDTNTPSGFASHWHTHNDNLGVISKETLKAVGQTVLEVIYNY